MELRPSSPHGPLLSQYQALFASCFPVATHLDAQYLSWLYGDNPAGTVVGFDAWDGDVLAAHYVCVPAAAMLHGKPSRVLLSLNTATSPSHQGKGLFTRLANATYERGTELGFDAVYGVANANSTPGFVKKLGFELLAPLDAAVGVGRLPLTSISAARTAAEFHRDWSPSALEWRSRNPARPYRVVRSGGRICAEAVTGRPGLKAWAELDDGNQDSLRLPSASFGLRLHLGLVPDVVRTRKMAWLDVPDRFRSSPLNLIFKPLGSETKVPHRDAIFFGQLDFDAF